MSDDIYAHHKHQLFQAADMWSFAIVLWEMVTREIPFKDYSPMQTGLKIATEHLRVLGKFT